MHHPPPNNLPGIRCAPNKSYKRWTRRPAVCVLAAADRRVLAVAFRHAPKTQRILTFAEIELGLTLLGLPGISDPPREEASRAVR